MATPEPKKLSFLPEEITTDILLRLPVKSIVRFKCICKSWMALFADPEFVKQHQKRAITSRKHKECLLMRHLLIPNPEFDMNIENKLAGKSSSKSCTRPERKEIYSVLSKESAKESGRVEVPVAGNVEPCSHTIIDSSNGIVCLTDSSTDGTSPLFQVQLWNPSTDELKVVPSYSTNRRRRRYVKVCAYGFAFHPTINDYRVVRIVTHFDRTDLPKVEMYSLGAQTWKTIANPNDHHIIINGLHLHDSVSRAFVNGSLHWIASKVEVEYNMETRFLFILTFNTRKEKLSEISLPREADIHHGDQFLLHKSNSDSDTLVSDYPLSLIVCKVNERRFEVWVLEKFRRGDNALWSKRRWFPMMEIMKPLHVLLGDDGGKMIMEMRVNGELVLCNSEFQIIRSLPFFRPARIVDHIQSDISLRHWRRELKL